LISFVHNLVTQGFLKAKQSTLMMQATSPAGFRHRLQTFLPQPSTKVLDALAAKTLLP
jgi:hypothetical protein